VVVIGIIVLVVAVVIVEVAAVVVVAAAAAHGPSKAMEKTILHLILSYLYFLPSVLPNSFTIPLLSTLSSCLFSYPSND
jgi:hypothetical protein